MNKIALLSLSSLLMAACQMTNNRGNLTGAAAKDVAVVPRILEVPGYGELRVIDYSPPSSHQFIGSPSLVKLDNGDLVASHDLFKGGDEQIGTFIFISKDSGLSWSKVNTQALAIHWGNLFVHQGALYLMGVDNKAGYSDVKIFRSTDNGLSWGDGSLVLNGKFHTAPVPMAIRNKRIYRAVEEYWGKNWGEFDALVMSAPIDADLLKPSSWTTSTRVRYEKEWPSSAFLEGNAVVSPNNKLLNILRSHSTSGDEHAAVLELDDNGKTLNYKQHIVFNGGSKKFTIRYDALSSKYWTLSNAILPSDPFNNSGGTERMRSRLTLMSSSNLEDWTMESQILYHEKTELSGFQYVDWQFDGDDIIAAIRTSFAGAGSSHDANFLTFRRIMGFRKLTQP